MRPERRALAAAAVVILILASCTRGGGPAVEPRTTLPLTGTLLVGPSQSFDGLGLYDLATRKLTRIEDVSVGGLGFFGALDFASGTFVGGPHSALAMVDSKLFRIQADRATQIGPRYSGGVLVGVAGGDAVATRCFPGQAGVAVLDLARATRWRDLGRVCGQALSPDGAEVAVTSSTRVGRSIFGGPQFLLGTKVWAERIDGTGSRRPLVDLATVSGLGRAMVTDPQVLEVAWGGPGLAVAVSNGQSGPWALVIVPTSGRPLVAPLGQAQPFDLAWQPHGDLLAFSDCYQCTTFGQNPAHTADVRILDPGTGELREIAAASNFLSGLVWSPAGDVVATRTSDNDLLFADAAGRTVVRRSVDAVPEDWAA